MRLGPGRPGWHIECSAMAMKYLGETLDIHTGGIDLTFPHHENEIAQAEGVTGKQFVKYWLHAEHLLVEWQKMSKSAGNFYTLRDLLEKGYTAEAIRYQLVQVPYRNKLNFTFDGLGASATALERLRNYKLRLKRRSSPRASAAITDATRKAHEAFDEAMDADLNTAEALGAIFEYVRVTNTAMDSGEFKAGNVAGACELLGHFDAIFQVLEAAVAEGAKSDADIQALVDERTQAKKARNFKRADEIRDQLASEGRARRYKGRRALEKKMKLATQAVHVGDRRKPSAAIPVATPIVSAASFIYDDIETVDKVFGDEIHGYAYARYGSPTTDALQELMTALESGAGSVATASGMMALQVAIQTALTDRRKSVVAASALYGATLKLLLSVFEPMGVEVRLVDICDLDAVAKAIDEAKPGCVVMETVSNPLLRVADPEAIAEVDTRGRRGVGGGQFFRDADAVRPLELGAHFRCIA
jgi:hypothetical protein